MSERENGSPDLKLGVFEVMGRAISNRADQTAMQPPRGMFSPKLRSSGRSIEDLVLPEGAIGFPELVFEDLIDEEVILDLVARAGKPEL